MARDRQRAKQRRKRQGGPAPRGDRSSANARDIGLDDATVDDAGLGELEEHTPNELKHSSADVDEALLAERGAIPPIRCATVPPTSMRRASPRPARRRRTSATASRSPGSTTTS